MFTYAIFFKKQEILDDMQGIQGKRAFNVSTQGWDQGEGSKVLMLGAKFKRMPKPSVIKINNI